MAISGKGSKKLIAKQTARETPREAPEGPARLHWAPGALLAPVPPALVTCGDGKRANVLTVAWTGIVSTKPPKTYISLRPERYSYGIIKESGCFVINLPTARMARTVDLCGVKTGAKEDKLALAGLKTLPASVVSAPLLADCPVALECRVTGITPMGSHHMFLADIVSVAVDPAMVDRAGRLMIERCGLLAYAHGTYFELGRALGTFGFSVRKKSPPKEAKRR